MFKVGDIVEITAEAAATGMLDFKYGKGYEVLDFRVAGAGGRTAQVYVFPESGTGDWYAASHFKLKEDNIVEKKECLFKEGQVVWDVLYGKGRVYAINLENIYCVSVLFDNGVDDAFKLDGKHGEGYKRSLFFSEPKIEAATEPLFEPALKKGDLIVAIDVTATLRSPCVLTAAEEDEHFVKTEEYGVMGKERWDFYRLGEKINFK